LEKFRCRLLPLVELLGFLEGGREEEEEEEEEEQGVNA
jgi:hypothetical protein